MASLKAKTTDNKDDFISLKIRKKDIESFCASAGLYRKEFLDLLKASASDHKEGRITRRNSLKELLSE